MAVIRWNPWSLDRLFEDDWDIPTIPGLSRIAGQGLNLYETEKEVIAEVALPGIPEDKIDVTIDEGVVRIVGSNLEQESEKAKRRTFMSSLSSSYNYTFRLPQGLIQDQEPVAEVSDGILKLIFPKMQKTPPKRLKITKKAKTPDPTTK
jgi:HSP20 family protein